MPRANEPALPSSGPPGALFRLTECAALSCVRPSAVAWAIMLALPE